MDNFHAKGDLMDITLGGTYLAGAMIALEDRAGVVTKGGGSGDVRPVLVEGIVTYAMAAVPITQGQKLYFHAGNNNVTTSSSSAKAVGWACETKASTATSIKLKLGAF